MTIYLYAELTDTYVPSEIQDIIGEYFDMNAGNPEERRFFQEWFDTQRQERDSSGRDLPELTTIQKLILQYPYIGDMLNHYFDRLKDSLEDDYAGDPFTTDLFFEAHDTFTYLEEYAFYDGRNPNPAKAAEMQRMLDEYSRRYNVDPPPAGSTDRRSLARSGTPRAGPAAEGGLNAFEAYRFNQLAERYLLHKHGRNSPPLSQELRHEFHALILRLPGGERSLWLERFNVVVPTSTPGTPTSVPTATLTPYPEDGLNINIVIERFNRHYDGTLGNEPPFSPAEIDYLRNSLLRWPDDFGILRLKFFELYPYELPTVTPEATQPLGPSAGLAVPPQLSMIHPYSLWHDEISKVANAASTTPAYYASGLETVVNTYAEWLPKRANDASTLPAYYLDALVTILGAGGVELLSAGEFAFSWADDAGPTLPQKKGWSYVDREAHAAIFERDPEKAARFLHGPFTEDQLPRPTPNPFHDLSKPLPQRWGPFTEPPELDESFIDDLYALRYGIDPKYAPRKRSDETALDNLLALIVPALNNPVPDFMRAEAGTQPLVRPSSGSQYVPEQPSRLLQAVAQPQPGVYYRDPTTQRQILILRDFIIDTDTGEILVDRRPSPVKSVTNAAARFIHRAGPAVSKAISSVGRVAGVTSWPLALMPLIDLVVGMETPAMAQLRHYSVDPFNPLTAEGYPTSEGSTDPYLALAILRNNSFRRPPLAEPAGPYGEYDPPYVRSTWGGWRDVDRDGLNTRQEVLLEESTADVWWINPSGNYRRATFGEWIDPFSDQRYTHADALHVDHMVPISNAHRSGAWEWDAERRRQYYNDSDYAGHLNAIYSETNIGKGSLGPEDWLPLNQRYWRQYAIDWLNIKVKYGLSATDRELAVLAALLGIDPEYQDLRDDTIPYDEIEPYPAQLPATAPAVGDPGYYTPLDED